MASSVLTEKVLEHQKTGSGFEQLMRDIVTDVIENKDAYGFRDKDEACDVLSQYYPRIHSLVRRFSGEGRTFEPYLYSSLKFYRKSLECKRREAAMREREMQDRDPALDDSGALGTWTDPEGPEPLPDAEALARELSLKPENGVCRSSARKRILYLSMKCAFSLDERQLEAIAEMANIPREHLGQRISFLRGLAQPRFERREYLSRLRDKLYASLCYYERKFHEEVDGLKKERFGAMAGRFRLRLRNCRERLEATRTEPTNTEIALVLGVPKGTVDSGIYCFKHFNAAKAG